jgi:hypothetical protein
VILTIDIAQTRTPFLRRLIPSCPTLGRELVLSIPDAIGRALLLTRFSVLPLINQSLTSFPLPATPTSLLLVPFILTAPFATLAFSGVNIFASSQLALTTPAELEPQGWKLVDAWLPLAVPALFCSLIGPVSGWDAGLGWSDDAAVVACVCFVLAAFMGRTVYTLGHERRQWRAMMGWVSGPRIKSS